MSFSDAMFVAEASHATIAAGENPHGNVDPFRLD